MQPVNVKERWVIQLLRQKGLLFPITICLEGFHHQFRFFLSWGSFDRVCSRPIVSLTHVLLVDAMFSPSLGCVVLLALPGGLGTGQVSYE